ncbi:MAG TPA: hypothetical protein VEU08_14940, partial [Vicinamibacterales bacterium]|nr:hypothetical protein [Vicinamibacterales bacterium]
MSTTKTRHHEPSSEHQADLSIDRKPSATAGAHTLLAVECPVCGSYTEESLPRLREADSLACGNCHSAIDVRSGHNRELI